MHLCKAGIRWQIPTPTQCCAPSTSLLLWPLSRQPPRGEQTFRVALEDVEVNHCWTCRCVVHLLIKDTASSAERVEWPCCAVQLLIKDTTSSAERVEWTCLTMCMYLQYQYTRQCTTCTFSVHLIVTQQCI